METNIIAELCQGLFFLNLLTHLVNPYIETKHGCKKRPWAVCSLKLLSDKSYKPCLASGIVGISGSDSACYRENKILVHKPWKHILQLQTDKNSTFLDISRIYSTEIAPLTHYLHTDPKLR